MSSIEYIDSIVLSSSSSTVSFTNIPQNYQDLILTANIRGITNSYPQITFNSDSSLSRTWITADGSSVTSSRLSDNYIVGGVFWNTTDFAFTTITNIFGYSNTSTFKTLLTESGNASVRVDLTVNTWRSTNAINSIQYIGSGGMSSGSSIYLWGVR